MSTTTTAAGKSPPTARSGFLSKGGRDSMWLEVFLQSLIDVAQSKQVSKPVGIICVILVSLLFLVGIASLFLFVFVIEGQSLLRRGAFLLMGLGILAYYLQFLSTIVRKRKDGRRQ